MISPPDLSHLRITIAPENFSIIDSSKLGTFCKCEREFFFNYVLHWRKNYPNIHLEFGTAWHLAKEHLLNHDLSPDSINAAYLKFLGHYRKYFSPEDDMNQVAKTPANALDALKSYCKQYAITNKTLKVHGTEISGKVLVDDIHSISYKIDAIVEDNEGIWCLDHKTASRDTPLFEDSWQMSDQMSIYTHALRSFYNPDTVRGAIIDATILRKMGNLHKRIKVRRSYLAQEEFLWTLSQRLQYIDHEFERLANCATSDPVLHAFPKNTKTCTMYGRCPYMDLCLSCPNPLKHAAIVPNGYKVEVWNPHAGDKSWKPKMTLENGELRTTNSEEQEHYDTVIAEHQAATEKDEDFTLGGFI